MSQENNEAVKVLAEQVLRAVDARLKPLQTQVNELEREVKTPLRALLNVFDRKAKKPLGSRVRDLEREIDALNERINGGN